MNKKDEIIKLYYDNNEKIINICNNLNVSRAYITKVIKVDNRYYSKKQALKDETKSRKKEYTKIKMRQSRADKSIEEAILKQQHIQASLELSSGNKTIGNRAFKNWNSSIYRYDDKTKSYKLKSNIVAGYDVPKKIKW